MGLNPLLLTGAALLAQVEDRFDDPTIPWKSLISTFIIAEYIFETYLDYRQYQVLQHTVVPQALQGVVSQKVHSDSQAYSRAKARFGFIHDAWNQAVNLGTIHYDLLPFFWSLTRTWQQAYLPANFQGELSHSVLYLFTTQFPMALIDMPWSYYRTFTIEEKFGFNKQTPTLFFKDFAITQVLVAVLGTPLLLAFLKIINFFGKRTFAFYVMVFLVAVQVVMISVYPIFIQPLFNKLVPLQEGEVKSKTEALAAKLKFPLGKLWVIDGSKRSAHSNAYFYGLPWAKQIVIYDTLIEQSTPMEVVAVLAHELGHWANWDTTRQLFIAEAYLFVFFLLFSTFIENGSMYRSFGFANEQPVLIGLMLFSYVWKPIDHTIKWMMQINSRRNEYGADKFALDLGYKDDLARALIKLQVKNLSAMDADWLYSAYNHSHPILVERLRALGYKGGENILEDKKEEVDGISE